MGWWDGADLFNLRVISETKSVHIARDDDEGFLALIHGTRSIMQRTSRKRDMRMMI